MPKNKVSDLITDQEMAFALLILSGAMTDRQAAEAVGLHPDSAAYIKSKPRVRAYMIEHRAAVEKHLVQQEAEGLRRLNLDRERVLDRLWEIADLSPEITRGSITGQVKALSMIVAMQNFIPDRRAASAEKKSTPVPANPPQIYEAAWLQEAKAKANDPQPSVAPAQQEDGPGVPAPEVAPGFAPASAQEAPPDPGPSQSTFANRVSPYESFVPDTRVPFSLKKNPFTRYR